MIRRLGYEDPSDRPTRWLLALFLLVAGVYSGWQGYRGVFGGEMVADDHGRSITITGEDANYLGWIYLVGGATCFIIGAVMAVRNLRR